MQFHLTLELPSSSSSFFFYYLFIYLFFCEGTLELPNNLNMQKKKKEKRIQHITQLINTCPFKFSFINRTSCNGLSIKCVYIYIYIILQDFTLL